MESTFKPRIIAFCCNWCAYAGADLAGVMRLQYPAMVRIIRVMCSGRMEPIMVAKTLFYGADGVLILGCHIGDCHYTTGNHYSKRRIAVLKRLLDHLGIDQRRVRIDWVSAAEGNNFAKIITEFTEEMKELGPLSLKEEFNDRLS